MSLKNVYQLSINGNRVYIVDSAELKRRKLNVSKFVHLGQYDRAAMGLYIRPYTRGELYKMSPLDNNLIDFAVPHGEYTKNDLKVWYYGDNKTFGAPVYDRAVWKHLAKVIAAKVYKTCVLCGIETANNSAYCDRGCEELEIFSFNVSKGVATKVLQKNNPYNHDAVKLQNGYMK